MNGIWTDFRVENLQEDLAQCVQSFFPNVGYACRQDQWQHEILAILHPYPSFIYTHRAKQDSCRRDCASRQIDTLGFDFHRLACHAVISADDNVIGSFLDRCHHQVRLVAEVLVMLKLPYCLLRAINVAVRTTMHAHATIDTAGILRLTRSLDCEARATISNSRVLEFASMAAHCAPHARRLAARE